MHPASVSIFPIYLEKLVFKIDKEGSIRPKIEVIFDRRSHMTVFVRLRQYRADVPGEDIEGNAHEAHAGLEEVIAILRYVAGLP